MRKLSILIFFTSLTFSAQKIKITDVETGKPIANARIVSDELALYANEDGMIEFPAGGKPFEVSAGGYKKQQISRFQNVIALQPTVKDIEEVKIINIDVQPIFKDVLKNYHKRYYNQPSVYDVVVRRKSYRNDKLASMVISEGKVWLASSAFNYKYAHKDEYDKIMQMQLKKLKYFKKGDADSVKSIESKEFKRDEFGSRFLNYELQRVLANVRSGKYSGRLLNEIDGEQTISFKTNSERGVKLDGFFKYDTKDKVITFIEVNYDMEEMPVKKMKSDQGEEFDYKYGVATVVFDFYKKDGFYVPGMHRSLGDRYVYFYKDKTVMLKSAHELYYNTFAKSTDAGLDKKENTSASLLAAGEVKDKEALILLSEEEQNFINEN